MYLDSACGDPRKPFQIDMILKKRRIYDPRCIGSMMTSVIIITLLSSTKWRVFRHFDNFLVEWGSHCLCRSHTRRRNSKYRDINPKNVVSITTLESLKSHSFFDNCVEKKETRFDRRIGNTCNINTSSTSVPSLITKPSIMGKSSTQKPLFTAPKRHRHTLYGTLLCVIRYCFLTHRVVIYDDDVDYHL